MVEPTKEAILLENTDEPILNNASATKRRKITKDISKLSVTI